VLDTQKGSHAVGRGDIRTYELLSWYRLAGTCAGSRRHVFAEPMFLLDTNVVSEPRRARPHRAVLAWEAAASE
jgi:hypothetical protein